ncbi:hypothetical protein FA13DRAFT_9745 [Coprinellus micaceus]|uniref:Uncharacterized protein n=1 Tax=Coprinellus micaceus TaxID=71717 RepID=A0A4Y7TZG9_COPMI|nr:hypothetical protein FA13DRAFT_9745 [Coprinellus micaceus]
MDSPTQYSPSSTPSDATPPTEEVNFQAPSGGNFDKGFLNTISGHLQSIAGSSTAGGSSKRRLGAGSAYGHGGHGSNRDAKSRRRENSGRMDSLGWEGKGPGGKREKDELLDQSLVDYLRKEIGDPFQEPSPQRS